MAVKILVADDSATMRKIMEMTFAGEDAEVVAVDSGDAAVAKARELRPDVVFADVSMAGTTGYEVARGIKNDSSLSGTAVIVLASQHTPYDGDKGAAAGVDDHVLKPFDTQQVIDKVLQLGSQPRAAAAPSGRPQPPPPPGGGRPQPPPQQTKGGAGPPQPPAQQPRSGGAQPPASAQGGAKPPPAPPAAQAGQRGPKSTVAFGASPAAPAQQASGPQPPPPPSSPSAQGPAPSSQAGGSQEPAIELDEEAPSAGGRAGGQAAAGTAAVAAAAGDGAAAAMTERLRELGLSQEQIDGVLNLSRAVVEQVVWEVVPDLAETIIREEIRRLTSE